MQLQGPPTYFNIQKAIHQSGLVQFYHVSENKKYTKKINLREKKVYLKTYIHGILYHYDIFQISARGFFMRRPRKKATHVKKNSLLCDDHACPDFFMCGGVTIGRNFTRTNIYPARVLGIGGPG